jgi:Fe-S-cluster containining protein
MKRSGYAFSFHPKACSTCAGNCCIGESGYIWATKKEQHAIAKHLKLSYSIFQEKYIDHFGGRASLKEKQLSTDNYACIFFDVEKRQCGIYNVRPIQCRTFPFWPYFKKDPQMVADECPGIQLAED